MRGRIGVAGDHDENVRAAARLADIKANGLGALGHAVDQELCEAALQSGDTGTDGAIPARQLAAVRRRNGHLIHEVPEHLRGRRHHDDRIVRARRRCGR